MAVQNGTEVTTGSTEITYYDTITVGAGGTVTTKFKAVGFDGLQISFVYKVKEDGTYEKSWSQVKKPNEEPDNWTPTENGTFTYNPKDKSINFATADPDKPVEGDTLVCAYKFKSANNAQTIEINSDGIPDVVLVAAYGIARDICTGELFPAVIEGQAQIDGNWNFDLSADGEPAVQSLNMEFVKGCLDKTLYTFKVFTEDEAS